MIFCISLAVSSSKVTLRLAPSPKTIGRFDSSDKFSIFNRYHEINDETLEASESEANVIIASPDLLLDNIKEERIDVSNINILVVDDINLIKKNHQLKKLNEILDMLPANKQNIVFTNRRSKETQDTLNKILKTPSEIKVDKAKESEVKEIKENKPAMPKNNKKEKPAGQIENMDRKALDLAKRYKVFGKRTPAFLLESNKLAHEED